MTEKFLACHEETLLWEGSGCHQAAGEDWWTCWGIAQRFNPEIFGENAKGEDGLPTKEQCFEQAYRKYWLTSGSENLVLPLALMHYDASFNMGLGTASKFLGQTADYVEYGTLRLNYYTNPDRRNRDLNLAGWVNRVASMLRTAREWDAGAGSGVQKVDMVLLWDFPLPILGNRLERLVAAMRGYQHTAMVRIDLPVELQVRPSTAAPDAKKVDLRVVRE